MQDSRKHLQRQLHVLMSSRSLISRQLLRQNQRVMWTIWLIVYVPVLFHGLLSPLVNIL